MIEIEKSFNREERQAMLNHLVAEETARLEALCFERIAVERGNKLNIDRLKQTLYRVAEVFGLIGSTLPRGYRVLGNGGKTPYYLVIGRGSDAPTADQFVADAMTGLLAEVADLCQRDIDRVKKIPAEGGAAR